MTALGQTRGSRGIVGSLSAGKKSKIASIQYARACAAVSVLFGHALYEARKLDGSSGAMVVRDMFPWWSGVDVFFVISGFIMVVTSSGRWNDPGYGWHFMRSRIVRIVPNYWFWTTVTVILLLVSPSSFDGTTFDLQRIAQSYLFFPGLNEITKPVLRLGWTLNYEMFFYIILAVSIAVVGRSAALLLGAAFVIFTILGQQQVEVIAAYVDFWSDPIIIEFVYGMCIGLAFLRGVRVHRWTGGLLIAAAVVVLWYMANFYTHESRFIVIGIPSAVIVAALAFVDRWHKAKSIGGYAFELAGTASYTLYLTHPFVITGVFVLWSTSGADKILGWWAYAFTVIAAAIGFSIVCYAVIEVPLNRRFSDLLIGKTRQSESV